jgi:predicted nucleic acid-binding protein
VLTIDASVWVNAYSPAEPESASSRALLDRVAGSRAVVIVPTLLRVWPRFHSCDGFHLTR